MKIQWSSDEEILLHKYLKKGFKYKKIAKLLGRTLVSTKNKIVRDRTRHGKFMDIPKKIKIRDKITGQFDMILDEKVPVWNNFITTKFSKSIITCDWHIPYVNMNTFNKMLDIAYKRNIKTLFIIGDFFSLEVFSYWTQSKDDIPAFSVELKIANKLLMELFKHFEDIIIITGNHERRYWNMLKGRDDFNTLLNFICGTAFNKKNQKILVSYYSYCELNDTVSKFKWRLTHQKNYSKVPLSIPRALANKYTGKHIISSHTHNLCIGYADDRERIIAEAGNMTDTKYFQYICKVDTLMGGWVPGFLSLVDGELRGHSNILG